MKRRTMLSFRLILRKLSMFIMMLVMVVLFYLWNENFIAVTWV
jgi:hypothetical protein